MEHSVGIQSSLIDNIALCRLVGQTKLQPGSQLIGQSIAQAFDRRISKLMIVITELTGYGVPSLAMRLGMIREWADAARGLVQVAFVCRPEFIDPHKIGIVMAANLGMIANVFETEDEGLAWLQNQA